ncbi:sensor histidine kinase [Sediminitomix flava]|uniref:histidine kinase n=1 Tax=Sediminitomix flava TaxID=379075 RepID=A0A315Z703_SEDFL|nr:ATP-binding protein [Sediminitomix flava]PWJ38451.1 PAS domain S-box-containing protein [Sediminitomix flava]
MLRLEYIFLTLLIVGTLLGITFPLRLEHPHLFIIAEVVSVIVLFWHLRLWYFFHRPLKELNNALNLLKHNDFQSRLITSPHPVVNKLVVVYNKIMERLQQERVKQQEQRYFLEHLINASPNGIVVLDYDGNVLQVNPSALQMTESKLEELKGKALGEIKNDFLKKLVSIPLDEVIEINLSGGRRYRCQKTSFIFKGFPQQFLIIQDSLALDMKKEKQAYSKVIRMMSHEVNNTVGAVNSYLDTLKIFAPEEDEVKDDYLEAIDVVQGRNTAMADFMKAFASVVKIPDVDLKEVDLGKLIDQVLLLFAQNIDEADIQIVKSYQNYKIPVLADRMLLEQVFINIFKNAVEAIQEASEDGGKLINVSWNPKKKTLEVWNSGNKIPREIEEQLFTPFFSSKANGQGIGLTICRDILMKHHWDYKLYSPEKGGAIFEIKI